MVLSGSTLGVEVTLWPTLETGIGLHLLDRNLGSLMAPAEIRRIGRVMDEETELGYRENPRDGSSDEIERAMVEHWSGLCFNTGGLDGALFLDRAKVEAHGRDAAWVRGPAQITGTCPVGRIASAVSLARCEVLPTTAAKVQMSGPARRAKGRDKCEAAGGVVLSENACSNPWGVTVRACDVAMIGTQGQVEFFTALNDADRCRPRPRAASGKFDQDRERYSGHRRKDAEQRG
jgi:hypothetical protein